MAGTGGFQASIQFWSALRRMPKGIFVMSLFLWGYAAWVLYAMTVLSVIAYAEELVLLCLLPEWKADVRGIYWVLSQRRALAS